MIQEETDNINTTIRIGYKFSYKSAYDSPWYKIKVVDCMLSRKTKKVEWILEAENKMTGNVTESMYSTDALLRMVEEPIQHFPDQEE